eukprot:752189-Rhodomonas_salina.1
MLPHIHYAVGGTQIGYAATRCPDGASRKEQRYRERGSLSSYALAMRCPVLRFAYAATSSHYQYCF